MAKFQVVSKAGANFGVWSGTSAVDVLAQMHRDAGYAAVRVEDGELVFPDAETAELCGGLDAWSVKEVD
jgi:hypothetical protein